MTNIVIVGATRTAVGSFNGAFANTPAHELGAVAVLQGLVGEHTKPTQSLCLSNTDGLRASEFKHAVQDMNGNGDPSRAAGFRPRA
jgi:acetyl-CoA acetyltransferase